MMIYSIISFNPYSNGSYSGSSFLLFQALYCAMSFNPYSNGSYSGRQVGRRRGARNVPVSILILMEVTLEDYRVRRRRVRRNRVSILI